MKTFVILSDSHGRSTKALSRLEPLFAENDYIIHLGDGSSDMRQIFSKYPEKVYTCRGNCDLFAYGEDEVIIEVEGISLLCCHGHKYGVKGGLEKLAAAAKAKNCDVALYGHTHIANIQTVDGVLCICPGALSSYIEPSYCYLVLHNGKPTATIVPLTD